MIFKSLSLFSPEQIAASGQCFRMFEKNGAWTVVHRDKLLKITPADGGFYFSCTENEFESVWREYFDLNEDYGRFCAAVAGDEFLECAAAFGRGIRILKQDPWETLCSFLISQNNNIPKIKKSVEMLCRAFGEERKTDDGESFRLFPSAHRLANLNREEEAFFRKECLLGYRDKFVSAAARGVATGKTDLKRMERLDNDNLFKELTALYGAGAKVASCVMLFGFHRIDAFPVDTWMKKILDARYGGRFNPEKYQGFQGVIQQYMFYYYRSLSQQTSFSLHKNPV